MPEPAPRAPDPPEPELRERGLLGGRLRLVEAVRGYRAGLDAGLLAAAVGACDGERVLEVGCGVGAALLQAAARGAGACFVGAERDAGALDLARRNLALNGLEGRIHLVRAEVEDGPGPHGLREFDAAFCNPPFFDDPQALRGPAPERRGAWLADAGLGAWIDFLLLSLREGGRATVIHRADRLGDLLAAFRAGAGSVRVLPVHPFAERPAKRVLVRAVRGGRAPLVILPPLVLHEPAGDGRARATPSADAVLRGDAELDWGADQSA